MSEPVLRVDHLAKRFGGLVATDNVNLDLATGELHAIIGPNGAGKTTLIGQIMGDLRPDSGAIYLGGHDIRRYSAAQRVRRGLTRTFQITQLLNDYSAIDNVALAVQAADGHSFRFWGSARADRLSQNAAESWLTRVGLRNRGHLRVSNLSHGERKQLELAIALALKPRVLLLDEPMAGLGSSESQQMTEILRGLKGELSMLLVEHDMDAVFSLADRISVLVNGRVILCGTAREVQSHPDVRAAYLGDGE